MEIVIVPWPSYSDDGTVDWWRVEVLHRGKKHLLSWSSRLWRFADETGARGLAGCSVSVFLDTFEAVSAVFSAQRGVTHKPLSVTEKRSNVTDAGVTVSRAQEPPWGGVTLSRRDTSGRDVTGERDSSPLRSGTVTPGNALGGKP